MITPYNAELDPYQGRTLYDDEERLIQMGYKFLGWNVFAEHSEEREHCIDSAHNYRSAFPNAWHSVRHTHDGTDITQWCTICKIYWKINDELG